MRLSARLAAMAVLAFAAIAPAAQGATVKLKSSPNPLPGSVFQGADGNQNAADQVSKKDWESLIGDPALKTIVDPRDPDREFGSGSKEDNPDGWIFNDPADSTPGKTNFKTAWQAFTEGSNLKLGFRRAESGGNAFLAFELNQDSRLWTNAAGSRIPCRTTGDLLITYNVANADATDIYLTAQEWQTATEDPATGCARTGTLGEVTGIADGTNVQGAVNNSVSNALSPELPPQPAGLPNNQTAIPSLLEPSGLNCGAADNWICSGLFGEAAIDLASVYEEDQGNPCFSFGSVWAHGRSSISESSALQDYVEPTPVSVRSCTASGFKWDDRNADGVWDKLQEPAIEGWKVWLDRDDNGEVDPGEVETTDSNGEYVFPNLDLGSYTVKELPLEDQDESLRRFDACSYPDPADCAAGHEVTITAENTNSTGNSFGNYATPRVELVKSLKPAGDSGLFNLLAEEDDGPGSISATDVGNNGTSGSQAASVGSWKLSESAGTGSDLGLYEQAGPNCLKRGSDESVPVTEGTVALRGGDDVICTFTNTRKTVPPPPTPPTPPAPTPPEAAAAPNGTVVIAKNVTNGATGSFAFTGSLGGFNLGSGGSRTESLPAGAYSVSEATTPGFALQSLVCSDAGDASGASSISGSTANINLQAGETVVCTYTNAPVGGVLPAIAGSARINGERGCVTGRTATVRVRGSSIERVRFFIGRKLVRHLFKPNRRGVWQLNYPTSRLSYGTTRVVARVRYVSGADPAGTTLRFNLSRCRQAVKPDFTG